MRLKVAAAPLSRWDHRVMNRILAAFALFVFRVYGRLRVVGLENVPATGAVLLAANHASYADPPLAWAAVYPRRRPWGIAKSELWDRPVVAYLLNCIGVYPVRRGAADRAAIRQALSLLERGEVVGIFPEGTRTSDGNLQPGRAGIALLMQKSGAPVVPVAILGTYAMMPRHRKWPRPARLTVAFGKPMHFDKEMGREEIVDALMAAIAQLMTENGQPTEPPTRAISTDAPTKAESAATAGGDG
jgi:1-acyl-sn-glycerol-3-phosphate acyltransferase